MENYVKQLTDIEQIVLKIAKDHLGTSFNLLKSNGYKHWIKNK